MERGHKIAIVGTNGIGKTTFLKSVLDLIPAISGECELGENLQIGYFEQEVKGENKTTCIEELWQELPSMRCVLPLQNADSLRSILRAR